LLQIPYVGVLIHKYSAGMSQPSLFKKYAYAWATLLLFLFSFVGHWITAWSIYQDEQQAHNQPIEVSQYIVQTTRDTLENWQSEFLQLIWQVAGLSFLWYIGSPQSKEGDDRKEEKLDALLRKVHGKTGEKIIKELDQKYPRV
jgi:hypothetical protein